MAKPRRPGIIPPAPSRQDGLYPREIKDDPTLRVLALAESADHVCYRYRIRAFVPRVREAGVSIDVESIAHGLFNRLRQARRCAGYDAVLLQRRLLPGWLLGQIRRQARRLIFDFDDAVLYRDSYDRRGPSSPKRAHRFAATVRACDAVIAGNAFLAEEARRLGAPADRVRVIPTCLEPADYRVATTIRAEPPALVWIGSSSTLQGLEQTLPIWDRLGATFPGLRIRIVCDRFPDLGRLRVEPIPWTEATEADDLANGSIGVAWVPDDPWSRGKCGLKVLQYLAAGLPVVANPVGVHPEMVRDGVNGFLARTEDDWVASIGRLLADPALRRQMGDEGRRIVEENYAVDRWVDAFHAALAAPSPSVISGLKSRRTSRALP